VSEPAAADPAAERDPETDRAVDPAELSSVGPHVAPDSEAGLHRRRAAHLYGLIISGAVLAAVSHAAHLWTVGLALLGTLVVYWVAETYVHFMAARIVHRRDLTGAERREALADGFPLVAACAWPIAVLLAEAVVGVPTETAVRVALIVIALTLVVVGWNMGGAGGITGWRRFVMAGLTGMLGVAMIGLKTLLH
jgi:hypothetical protein